MALCTSINESIHTVVFPYYCLFLSLVGIDVVLG